MTSPADSRSAPTNSRLTYEDYLSLPDDGRRYEILDGELAVTASPTTLHQRVSRNLEFLLHREVQARGLGEVFDAPVDVILDESTVVVPDLAFVSKDRSSIVGERAIEGAPDLTVEILSASTERRGDAYELAADLTDEEIYECVVPNGVRIELSEVWSG